MLWLIRPTTQIDQPPAATCVRGPANTEFFSVFGYNLLSMAPAACIKTGVSLSSVSDHTKNFLNQKIFVFELYQLFQLEIREKIALKPSFSHACT
jgi:hypothetical protein